MEKQLELFIEQEQEQEQEEERGMTIVDRYKETLRELNRRRQAAKQAQGMVERNKTQHEAFDARLALRQDFQDFEELHGWAVADALLEKAFMECLEEGCLLLTRHDVRFAEKDC